jgi:hypothetical protein
MQHRCPDDDLAFAAAFESASIAPDAFSHRDHLRLAYVYLHSSDVDTACDRMRAALLEFLDRHGIATKYHETMTRAWILAVSHFLRRAEVARSADEFIDANPALLDPDIMLTHYSARRLFSDDARTGFVEPDLEPIPRDPKR